MSDKDIVLVEGVRTPFVKSGTDAKDLTPQELGRQVMQALFKKLALEPSEVDEFIFGCVAQPAEAANVTRVAQINAGLPRMIDRRAFLDKCRLSPKPCIRSWPGKPSWWSLGAWRVCLLHRFFIIRRPSPFLVD